MKRGLQMRRILGTFVCVFALGACAGGGSTPASGPAQSKSAVALSIHIPETTTSSGKRVPKYVSPSTQGLQVTDSVHGSGTTAFTANVDLSPGSASCIAVTGGRTCTTSIAAPATSDDFTLTTYDAPPSSANFGQAAHELGTATVTTTIVGGSSNTVSVALGGLPASLRLLVPYGSFYGNAALAFSLGMQALDADGNIILAGFNTAVNGANSETDTYASPITVSLTEAHPNGGGDMKLSLNGGPAATQVTVTKTSDAVSAAYDGLAPANYSVSFFATAASVSPNPPASIAVPLFMSGSGAGAFVNGVSPSLPFQLPTLAETFTLAEAAFTGVFTAQSTNLGTANCPAGSISVDTSQIQAAGTFKVTAGVAATANTGCSIRVGDGITASTILSVIRPPVLYVTNDASAANTVTAYAGNPSGNVTSAPLLTIGGANTGLNSPLAVALDGNGKMYVVNNNASVTVYAAGANGNVAPIATISGRITGLISPLGVAIDANGEIYVANNTGSGAGFIDVYAAGANGTVPPIATIGGGTTGISGPSDVAIGPGGLIYVTNESSTSVTIYSANPSGNLTGPPLALISGSNTQITSPSGVAVDASGNIYVVNSGNNNVLVFAVGSNGNVAPIAKIGGGSTGLNVPTNVALDASGEIYITNFGNNTVSVFAANPSGNVTSAPIATYGGGSTALNFPRGAAIQ
jgi:6-phosphogluconolactonase (cycloisomerase 2 family)